MRHEAEEYLYHVRNAARLLRDFTSGRSFTSDQNIDMRTWTTLKLRLDDFELA